MLTSATAQGYDLRTAANSAAGGRSPESKRRTSAHHEAGAFFVPGLHVYGGCAWEALACRVPFAPVCEPAHSHPHRFAANGGGSKAKGALPMTFLPTRNPSARAAAHRAMAKAALFADSSAAVRLKRYNSHMQKARTLEAAAGAQEVQS